MGLNVVEFCTPPVPGQPHKYYGNAHNSYIKLPVSMPTTGINKLNSNHSNNNTHTTPTLHAIATSGNIILLKQILPYMANPFKAVNEPRPSTGLTPLQFAASRGHFNIVQYLIEEYNASIDAKDKEGETALLKASYNGHFHIVKYLISKKANVHLKDKDGWTALHNACARGYLPITRLLVQYGARVDVKSKMGHTPLINAASKGYISIVEYLLLDAHANPLIKNSFGEAAYDVSASAGESYICEMLYKAGDAWWKMQHHNDNSSYNLLDFHVTVMVVIHENERSSSLLGLSKPHFSTAYLTKQDARGPWSRHPSDIPCTKEEVQLPPKAGGYSDWFWLTDWQIDYTDPRIDPTSGWQYAKSFNDPDEVWTPVTPTSGYGWVRRRKWVRVMKRRMDLVKGQHMGEQSTLEEGEDYVCEAEEIVQNAKLDDNNDTSIQKLTSELRALEEAVQLLRSGIKNDGNQYRIHQANTLITHYASQIDTMNNQIAKLALIVSTPITSTPLQHNPELARELGFITKNEDTMTTKKGSHGTEESSNSSSNHSNNNNGDFDANPWSRDASLTDWKLSNILQSSSLNHVDLIGHGMENASPVQNEIRGDESVRKYVWEPNMDVKECRGCRRRFGLLVRRHHCRCCGLIHCDRCTQSRAYLEPSQIIQDPNNTMESLEVLASHHQRVCDLCYARLSGLPP